MDQFDYTFVGLDNLENPLSASRSNRLDYVKDNAAQDGVVDPAVGDIKAGMSSGNYTYDAIGQLLSDADEGISNIVWRKGDKKIQKMTRNVANASNLEFVYNPFGIRILKIEKPLDGSGIPLSQDQWKYTYYAHDANGQTMAVYDVTLSSGLNQATLDEHHVYGSSRLGMIKQGEQLYNNGVLSPPASDVYFNTLAERRYELTNHLGNVQAIITDRKTWNATEGNFEAAVVMTSDYYPFGMQMPGRIKDGAQPQSDGTFLASDYAAFIKDDYRYAYNGMEVDNEVSGNGNSYTTEFRQYDPRLGRWKSLDPVIHSNQSPFCGMDNNPIIYNDPLGDDVGYESKKDKRKVFFKKIFSKKFREKHKERELSPNLYTYKGRPNAPKLQNAKADRTPLKDVDGQESYDVEYAVAGRRSSGSSKPPKERYTQDIYVTKYKRAMDEESFKRTEGMKQRTFNVEPGNIDVDIQTYNVPDQIRIYDDNGVLVNHTDQGIHFSEPRKDIQTWHDLPQNFEYVATKKNVVRLTVNSSNGTIRITINESGKAVSDKGLSIKTDFNIWVEGVNMKTKHKVKTRFRKPKRPVIRRVRGKRHK